MELLIPVVLKLFPNALPSTFEDKFAAVRTYRFALKYLSAKPCTGGETAEAASCPPGDGQVPPGDPS